MEKPYKTLFTSMSFVKAKAVTLYWGVCICTCEIYMTIIAQKWGRKWNITQNVLRFYVK